MRGSALDGVVLRPYQRDALAAIVAGLREGGRGGVHAACGTGKTAVAEAAARALVAPSGLVAVVVPSVALVAQFLNAWTGQGGWAAFGICGDEGVADSVRVADLPCPVSLDVDTIAAWVTGPVAARRVVICTLYSAGVLGEALRAADVVADLLIVDEAHRTAGVRGKASAVVHDDRSVPAARRLYMTATPRIASGGTDRSVLSMDNAAVFGPVLHSFPFSRAIAEGWLDDYRLIVVGVTRADTLALLEDLDERATPVDDPTAPPAGCPRATYTT